MKESRQIPFGEKYALLEAMLQSDFLQEVAAELGMKFSYWHFQEVSRIIQWVSPAFLKDFHQRGFATLIGSDRFGADPDPGPQIIRQGSGREKLVQVAASIMVQSVLRFSAKENLVSAQAHLEELEIQDEYELHSCPFKGGRITNQLAGFLAWSKGNLWGLHTLEKMNDHEAVTSALTYVESLTIASLALAKTSEIIARCKSEDELKARWLFFLDLVVRWGYLDFESKGGYLFASLSEVESKLLGRHTLDKIAEGTLIREQYRHSKRDLERSRERLKFYYQHKDYFNNSLGIVYLFHYGLTPDQKRISRDNLALRYAVNTTTIKDWISFFEYLVKHPELQEADSDLFRQSERKYPIVLEFLNKRRLELVRRKREELESMMENGSWKQAYRSLGVLEFDLFLLRSMEDLLLKGVAYYPACDLIAKRAEILLSKDYVDSQIKVTSTTIQERIGLQTGILRHQRKERAGRSRVMVPGLEIIDAIEARDLLAAYRAEDYSRMANSDFPSTIIYKKIRPKEADYQGEARVLGLLRQVFTSFGDIAIVNLLVSNLLSEEDLRVLFDPKVYFTSFDGIDDPRACRLTGDDKAELKRRLGITILFVLRKVDSFRSLRRSLIRRFTNLSREGMAIPPYFEMFILEEIARNRRPICDTTLEILASQGIVLPENTQLKSLRGLPLRLYNVMSDAKRVLLAYYFN